MTITTKIEDSSIANSFQLHFVAIEMLKRDSFARSNA